MNSKICGPLALTVWSLVGCTQTVDTSGGAGSAGASGQAGGGQGGAGQAGSGQAGAGQAGAGQAGSGQAGSDQAGAGQAGSGGEQGGAAGEAGAGGAGEAGAGGGNEFDDKLPAPDMTPSKVVFDVKWKDSTAQIPSADALASLEAVPPADGVYKFRAPLPAGADKIEAGKHLLLEGIGLFMVTGVNTDEQGTLAVSTEPGSLLEAADEGNIDVDLNLALDGGVNGVGFPGLIPQGILPAGWQNQMPGPTSYEFTSGKFKLKYSVTPPSPDAPQSPDYEIKFEGGMDPDEKGATAKFNSTAKLRNLRAVARMQWSGGQPVAPGIVAIRTTLVGSAKLSLTALTGGVKFKVPAKYAIPFSMGPVPMFVMLQPSIELNATIQKPSDTTVSDVRYYWTGGVGFNIDTSGNPSPGADNTAGESNGGGEAATAPVPAGQYTFGGGIVGEIRADLGVGVLLPPTPVNFHPETGEILELPQQQDALARASIYAKFKGEGISNYTVKPGNSNCLAASANAGIYVGGELKLFSFPVLQSETQTWGVTKTKNEPTGCGN